MAYDLVMEKALFDTQAAEYELWYQTPQGRYADALEKELFLRLMLDIASRKLGTGVELHWGYAEE